MRLEKTLYAENLKKESGTQPNTSESFTAIFLETVRLLFSRSETTWTETPSFPASSFCVHPRISRLRKIASPGDVCALALLRESIWSAGVKSSSSTTTFSGLYISRIVFSRTAGILRARISIWGFFTTTNIVNLYFDAVILADPTGHPLVGKVAMVLVRTEFGVVSESRLNRSCLLHRIDEQVHLLPLVERKLLQPFLCVLCETNFEHTLNIHNFCVIVNTFS